MLRVVPSIGDQGDRKHFDLLDLINWGKVPPSIGDQGDRKGRPYPTRI